MSTERDELLAGCGKIEVEVPQGLKPAMNIKALNAALKRCSTQNQSFPAACEAVPSHASHVQGFGGLLRCGNVRELAHHGLPAALGPPEVVLGLHVHPQFRGGAQGSREAESHVRGYSRLAVQHS